MCKKENINIVMFLKKEGIISITEGEKFQEKILIKSCIIEDTPAINSLFYA